MVGEIDTYSERAQYNLIATWRATAILRMVGADEDDWHPTGIRLAGKIAPHSMSDVCIVG